MDDLDDLASRLPGQAAQVQADQLRASRGRLARLLGIRSGDERAWSVGAQGERRVAARLAKLMRPEDGWFVLHAVPVGVRGSDIDHVAIGPLGVFAINSKHHPNGRVWVRKDAVLVNGQRVPYVRNSRHEAARVARLLSAATGLDVAVSGLVVTVGADLKIKEQPDDVWIGTRRDLRRMLRRREALLSDEQVALIYAAARVPGTWR